MNWQDDLTDQLNNTVDRVKQEVINRTVKLALFVGTALVTLASAMFTGLVLLQKMLENGSFLYFFGSVLCIFSVIYFTFVIISDNYA